MKNTNKASAFLLRTWADMQTKKKKSEEKKKSSHSQDQPLLISLKVREQLSICQVLNCFNLKDGWTIPARQPHSRGMWEQHIFTYTRGLWSILFQLLYGSVTGGIVLSQKGGEPVFCRGCAGRLTLVNTLCNDVGCMYMITSSSEGERITGLHKEPRNTSHTQSWMPPTGKGFVISKHFRQSFTHPITCHNFMGVTQM